MITRAVPVPAQEDQPDDSCRIPQREHTALAGGHGGRLFSTLSWFRHSGEAEEEAVATGTAHSNCCRWPGSTPSLLAALLPNASDRDFHRATQGGDVSTSLEGIASCPIHRNRRDEGWAGWPLVAEMSGPNAQSSSEQRMPRELSGCLRSSKEGRVEAEARRKNPCRHPSLPSFSKGSEPVVSKRGAGVTVQGGGGAPPCTHTCAHTHLHTQLHSCAHTRVSFSFTSGHPVIASSWGMAEDEF